MMDYMRNAFPMAKLGPVAANSAALCLLLLAGCAAPPLQAPPAAAPQAPAVIAKDIAPPPAPVAIPAPTAPAPQQTQRTDLQEKIDILRKWVGQQQRLYRVAAPLLLENTQLCVRHSRTLLGFTAKTRYSYGDAYIAAAEAAFGLNDRLQIMGILPGSAAAQAGLREGDVLIAVEIEPLPQGPRAEQDSAPIIGAEMQGRSSIKLTVLRGDERTTINVALTPACAMTINLGDTDLINSYADGNRILVTRGMLEYAVLDDELAYVLVREIAHNILAQEARPDMAAVIDRLQSLNAETTDAKFVDASFVDERVAPYSPATDAAADILALYLLARAGYNFENALDFWKKLASNDPGAAGYRHTRLHPDSTHRFSIIAETSRAIKLKLQLNQALLP